MKTARLAEIPGTGDDQCRQCNQASSDSSNTLLSQMAMMCITSRAAGKPAQLWLGGSCSPTVTRACGLTTQLPRHAASVCIALRDQENVACAADVEYQLGPKQLVWPVGLRVDLYLCE